MQDISNALLSTQRALLDAISPELRAVIVDLDNHTNLFFIRFYYDDEVSEKLIDLWECAITEASAGLDPEYALDEGVERLDYPSPIPLRGRYAYLRKESSAPCICKPNTIHVELTPISRGLLAIQSALLGIVTTELRVVVVDYCGEGQLLYMRFYYDGEIPQTLIELWQRAIMVASAGFGLDHTLDSGIERCDYPKQTPFRGRYAYIRKE